MKTLALYARTSTLTQTNGLESQIRALRGYCEAMGFEDYRIYQDSGISGKRASRPGLDNLLADIEAGQIAQVVTYSLSRLSRSTAHLLQVIEFLKAKNVGFISLSESIDLSSPMGVMILTVLGAVAQLEREITVERVKTGIANAKAKGKKLGAPKKQINPALLAQLQSQNLTYLEIGRMLGCSAATVCREIKRISESLAS